METVDPREVVKAAFRLVEVFPPGEFNIWVRTEHDEPAGLLGDEYIIQKTNEGPFIIYTNDAEFESITIRSYKDLETLLLKKSVITSVMCTKIKNGYHSDPYLMFSCYEHDCLDRVRYATRKIQSEFRKSRGYAAWKYHPTRLKAQGYFNDLSFGKRKPKNPALQRVNNEIKYLR